MNTPRIHYKLKDWLQWQEQLHPYEIELGLERINTVMSALGLHQPHYKVITIAGTNGKGSCAAMLESMLQHSGYRTGCYTSPHLLSYNERIRVNGHNVSDEEICQAFVEVDGGRGQGSLSYFEFGTLAALQIFAHNDLDVVILEVGMGGRLDAVNVLDADVALITTIDIDHQDWLGSDREQIAVEKAGILRAGKPAVYGASNPPQSLLDIIDEKGIKLALCGRDYGHSVDEVQQQGRWTWWCHEGSAHSELTVDLPPLSLQGEFQFYNASAALMVLQLLAPVLPCATEAMCKGLENTQLSGRMQMVQHRRTVILDVAHNVQAAQALAAALKTLPHDGECYAVFGFMADKQWREILDMLQQQDIIDHWYAVDLGVERAENSAVIAHHLSQTGSSNVRRFDNVASAYDAMCEHSGKDDRVVVFGSFLSVAAMLKIMAESNPERVQESMGDSIDSY